MAKKASESYIVNINGTKLANQAYSGEDKQNKFVLYYKSVQLACKKQLKAVFL